MSTNITADATMASIKAFFTANPTKVAVFYNWASWNEPSQANAEVVAELASDYPDVAFFKVDADAPGAAEICGVFALKTIPCVTAYCGAKLLGCVPSFDPEATATMLATAAAEATGISEAAKAAAAEAVKSAATAVAQPPLEERLKALVNQAPVMLFMKGAPAAPRCGFSRTIVEILNSHGILFSSFDILSDNDVREGLKKFSNWPTYPQLYCQGELLGGLDVIKELVAAEELIESVPEEARGPIPAQ